MDWTTFGAVAGLISIQTMILLWMMSKLDSDIKAVAADSNAKWMAVNARLDFNQAAILRLLEKQAK